MFTRVDALVEEHKRYPPLTSGEAARLGEEFMISFIYNSNAIEGNLLTLQETALVLEGTVVSQKPLKDHLEAVGHRDAFQYVLGLIQQQEPLSERMIKEIHSLILLDKPRDKGVYRQVPVRIMGAVHEPVQPYLIPERMAQLLEEYYCTGATYHFVERVARLHLDFEAVHPFIDGNGRTGRLLVNLELMKAGYPPIDIKYTDRRRYYDSFTAYHQTGQPEMMARLFGDYLEQELQRYIAILKAAKQLEG